MGNASDFVDQERVRLSKRAENARLKIAKETESEKCVRLAKRREKCVRLAKRREKYKKSRSLNNNKCQTNDEHLTSLTKANESVDKSMYLGEFNSLKNGPLHEQSCIQFNMKVFHRSTEYAIFQCTVCKEAWPINTKPKLPSSYVCLRCSRDKNKPKKFSDANSMIPWPVPLELQHLTQTEEMLIARALPIMRFTLNQVDKEVI